MYDSLRIIFIISATNCIFNQFQPLDKLRPAFLLPSRSAPALCTPILPQDRPLVKTGSRGKFRHRMLYSRASCAKGVDLCHSPCSDLFTSRKIFLLHTFRELPRPGPCVIFKRSTTRKDCLLHKYAHPSRFSSVTLRNAPSRGIESRSI